MPNKHAVALGKLGGKSKSAAKQAASRKNGRLGGRPKKKEAPPGLSKEVESKES